MSKERSLILRGWEVRAIIEGRKTQMRRAVKLPKHASKYAEFHHLDPLETAVFTDGTWAHCPVGQIGDRLWGREAWAKLDWPEKTVYRADGDLGLIRWSSPVQMPRWASRILLDVVAVRVERLQGITEADARAEGHLPVVHEDGAVDCGTRKTNFVKQWESDHGAGSWDANPWVWVVEFRANA